MDLFLLIQKKILKSSTIGLFYAVLGVSSLYVKRFLMKL